MDFDKEYQIDLISMDGKSIYNVRVVKKAIVINDKTQRTERGFLSKALYIFDGALNESYGYLPLAAYTFVFNFLSVIPNSQNLLCLYFALLSFIIFVTDEGCKLHKIKTSNCRNTILVILFIVVISATILTQRYLSPECINTLGTVIGGSLLLITCIAPFIESFYHFYKTADQA